MKKFTVYGAGQIGLQLLTDLFNSDVEAEIVLYSPHNFKRTEGAYEDLKDAAALRGYQTKLRVVATGDTSQINNSDAVFFCAGVFPKPEEYEIALKQGIDDRLLQAVKNMEILNKFCNDVSAFSPKAKVFIITNPVDMMTEIARNKLPDNEVYGMGCYLDTARFRRELAELMQANGQPINIADMNAWILGHHSGTMFLHKASFDLKVDDKLVEEALTKTRNRGLTITKINSAAPSQKLNNGAYFAPAIMATAVIKSLALNQTLLLPLNRPICPEDNLGEITGAAQLLTKIESGKIMPQPLPFNNEDLAALKTSIEAYENGKKAFAKFIEQ